MAAKKSGSLFVKDKEWLLTCAFFMPVEPAVGRHDSVPWLQISLNMRPLAAVSPLALMSGCLFHHFYGP